MLAKSPRYNVYPLICSDSGSGRVPCLGLISVSVIISYLLVCIRTRSSSNFDKRELSNNNNNNNNNNNICLKSNIQTSSVDNLRCYT